MYYLLPDAQIRKFRISSDFDRLIDKNHKSPQKRCKPLQIGSFLKSYLGWQMARYIYISLPIAKWVILPYYREKSNFHFDRI